MGLSKWRSPQNAPLTDQTGSHRNQQLAYHCALFFLHLAECVSINGRARNRFIIPTSLSSPFFSRARSMGDRHEKDIEKLSRPSPKSMRSLANPELASGGLTCQSRSSTRCDQSGLFLTILAAKLARGQMDAGEWN